MTISRGDGPLSVSLEDVGARLVDQVRVLTDEGDGRMILEVTEDGVAFTVARNSHGSLVCCCGRAANTSMCYHKSAIRRYLAGLVT